MADNHLNKQEEQLRVQAEARAKAEFERALKEAMSYAERDPIAKNNAKVQALLSEVSGITMNIPSPLRETLATQLIAAVQEVKAGPAFPIGHPTLLTGETIIGVQDPDGTPVAIRDEELTRN